jgi:hypothetical protein
VEGEPFVPMKPVVEGMGLTWQGQHEKLNQNPERWGVRVTLIPSEGGQQQALCMPLRKLPGWLMTIQPSRLKEEIRETVIAYQNECDDVLWEYWTKGKAENPRPAPSSTLLPHDQAAQSVPVFVAAAEAFGFKGNQATLSANKAIAHFTGFNLLEAMGQAQLVAPDNDPLITVSDIAKRLNLATKSVNPMLTGYGLQNAFRDHKNKLYYELTEEGEQYGVMIDTDKKHNSGAPVRQVKWRSSVIPVLEQRLLDELTG